ncbi:MAG: hypothetical protein LBO67_01835 [Spirochaetaceae bacterium]|nr:hypothetical protein [Spirochaetaceae bacterium]
MTLFLEPLRLVKCPVINIPFIVYDVILYPEVKPYTFTGLFPLLVLRITGDMQNQFCVCPLRSFWYLFQTLNPERLLKPLHKQPVPDNPVGYAGLL